MKSTETLIAQLKSNAVEAFDRLIEQYGDRLYWHIRRIVVHHEDAEDVLQETWLAAYTHLDTLTDQAAEKAWLLQVLRPVRKEKSKES